MIVLPLSYAPMNPNTLIVFDQAFKQRKQQLKPSETDSTFFEFFSAEQVLRDYPLSPDDIDSGLVGQDVTKPSHSGSDGGIDSIYVIVNGKLIRILIRRYTCKIYKKLSHLI